MNLRSWLRRRDAGYLLHRAARLAARYGWTAGKASRRTVRFLEKAAAHRGAATLLVPGRVLDRYPGRVLEMREAGAEIAVHSYDHFDLSALDPAEMRAQWGRAAESFARWGIETHGFRCPYLGYSNEVRGSLPEGLFQYSSNRAIAWEPDFRGLPGEIEDFFGTLNGFYRPLPSGSFVSLPWETPPVTEIPVTVPDDLQIADGLRLPQERVRGHWTRVLERIFARGELFNLMFHPELLPVCEPALVGFLEDAGKLTPPVWFARLKDIADWWREKDAFSVEVDPAGEGLLVRFRASARATILVRGFPGLDGAARPWSGGYDRIFADRIRVPSSPRPFIGLGPDVSPEARSVLRRLGYVLETGGSARSNGIFLDGPTVAKLGTEVALAEYVEAQAAPLVRFWPWPDGHRCTVCLSGDLDALTLFDYASRFLTRRPGAAA